MGVCVQRRASPSIVSNMRNPNCSLCPLHGYAKNKCLLVPEPVPCDVMIIAESPTVVDDTNNRVFVGKQLKAIKAKFESEGLSVHCTFAVKCFKPKDVKVSASMRKACRKYMIEELEAVKPKHVIALGATAVYAATGRAHKITEMRGAPFKDPKLPYTVYATVHQAQAAYSEENRITMEQDFTLFIDWIKHGVDNVAKFNPPVKVADSVSALRKLQRLIRESGGKAAADTETTGLFEWAMNGRVRCLQLCWDVKFGGVFIPLDIGKGCYYKEKGPDGREEHVEATFWPNGDYEEGIKILREILLETKLIWHNGKFDRKWLWVWGKKRFGKPILAPNILMDTMHVAFLLNENRSLALKKLITSEFGIPSYDIADKLTKDMDILIPYATRDTVASLMLYEKYNSELNKPGMERLKLLYRKVLRRADKLYTKIELEGCPVSFRRTEMLCKALEKRQKSITQRMVRILDRRGYTVNPQVFASPTKLGKLLFEEMGYLPSPDKTLALTKSGGLSTGEDALLHLKGDKFIDKLFEWRGVSKALSTYALPMNDASVQRGKLSTSYKLAKVVTGRTASGKEGANKSAVGMNMQNIPPTFSIKRCVYEEPVTERDREDPWWIVEVDFSQIELRVAAEYSKDAKLIWAYQNGIDLHTFRAKRILGVTDEEWDAMSPSEQKKARKNAKPCNFGFLYGMSAHKFQQYALLQYGVELSGKDAQRFREIFFDDHEGLPAWYAKQERQAERLGYVEALSGRRRHLPDINLNPESSREAKSKRQEAIRQAINSPVQCFASDLKMMSMIEIDMNLDRRYARMIGEVHDSIVLRVRKSKIHEVVDICLEVMRHPSILDELGIKLTVPIEADAECGPSWGGKKELKEWSLLAS